MGTRCVHAQRERGYLIGAREGHTKTLLTSAASRMDFLAEHAQALCGFLSGQFFFLVALSAFMGFGYCQGTFFTGCFSQNRVCARSWAGLCDKPRTGGTCDRRFWRAQSRFRLVALVRGHFSAGRGCVCTGLVVCAMPRAVVGRGAEAARPPFVCAAGARGRRR